MSYSALSDLCVQPTLIAPTEKYKQLVHDSTAELLQPIQCILSALDRRSMGLSKCASYNAALPDADVMQQLSPTLALGYLREAMIYSEQGKQHLVIDICNQALGIVDTNNPDYATLQQAKSDAEQQQSKCIDFVSQLPIDIVSTKLIPMFMHDNVIVTSNPCQYLKVSHLWRDRIIQCFDGLHFDIGENDNGRQCSQVIQLSQHTKALTIDGFSKGTWLCNLLSNNDFSSLKELEIKGLDSSSIDQFLRSLKSISSTLTHFHIDMESGPTLPAATLISDCANLVSLSIMDTSSADLSSLPTKSWSNLSSLVFTSKPVQIDIDQILGIWKRFPSLKYFQLYPCADIHAALIVTDYYPSMKRLEVVFSVFGVDIMCNDEGSPSESIGITHLSLDGVSLPLYPIMNVYSILERYHSTLEEMDLKMSLDTKISAICDIQYPQLKKLYLHSPAWWIPRNAPVLQELDISSTTINSNPAVLDTIPPHLQKLQLRLAHDPYIQNKAAIERYLLRLAQQSQLKELVILFNSMDNVQTLLDAICHLHQLQSLMISFSYKWPSSGIEPFFENLVQKCPHLFSLGMQCQSLPSTYTMNTLKQLEHLQHLAFPIYWIHDNAEFWLALEEFSQLKEIRIYHADSVDHPRIQHLKKRRPDITITVSGYFLLPI
ncbi:hypothetical protein LRAMOSA08984 [Lichtheimia ramosa]|uniref:F-box domain-containing protein n=1 Tax=Lichtheimia ramosa TaxID=688394 RepID=A0A077WFQ3_9FUNG|nr:hypothetical protein LRAMOSA08984 [Lichtheimia ramosa]